MALFLIKRICRNLMTVEVCQTRALSLGSYLRCSSKEESRPWYGITISRKPCVPVTSEEMWRRIADIMPPGPLEDFNHKRVQEGAELLKQRWSAQERRTQRLAFRAKSGFSGSTGQLQRGPPTVRDSPRERWNRRSVDSYGRDQEMTTNAERFVSSKTGRMVYNGRLGNTNRGRLIIANDGSFDRDRRDQKMTNNEVNKYQGGRSEGTENRPLGSYRKGMERAPTWMGKRNELEQDKITLEGM